ncbi:MAG: TIGR02996 domain-containing protein [Deltaproteobacteria bacterium]|nr:TIGR02996 domain-containing protein [Deltaproteobacteria bacterium]
MARARAKKAAAPVDPARAAIEEAIRKDPKDPAPYLVLADLLQTHGDPRGELIAVQEALAGVPTERLRALEEDMLEEYQEALLGPLHAALEELGPLPGRQMIGLEWRRGFLRGVTVRVRERGRELVKVVRALAASPAATFLEAFDASVRLGDKDHAAFMAELADAMPATLRELALTTMYSEIDARALWPSVPDLRALRLMSHETGCVLGDLPARALEVLEVNSLSGDAAEELLAKKLPKLRHLSLDLHAQASDRVLALLHGARPELRHLGLAPWGTIDVGDVQLGAIESLRLAGVTSATLRALVANGKKLRSLDLGFRGVEPRDLAPILDGALPDLVHLGVGPIDSRYHDLELLGRSKILPRLETLVLRDFASYQIGDLTRAHKLLAKVPRLEIYCPNLERSHRAHELAAATRKLPNLRLVRQTI